MRRARSRESAIDRINGRTYRSPSVVRYYGHVSGWLDAGERAAIDSALHSGATPPLLDIGVGGGRSVPLLRSISSSYIGIDYAPEMIERARERYPDVDLRVMDARCLDLGADQFGLALFSFNGLDSVGEVGRATILEEVRRVLKPGGFFVFSSLNHHGTADRALMRTPGKGWWHHPRQLARWTFQTLQTVLNVERTRGLVQEEPDASIRPVRAHASGLIARYTSLERQCAELRVHGFEVHACFAPDGQPADSLRDHRGFTHFHYVACRSS